MFKVKNASPTYHDTSTADAQSAAADGGYHFATIGNTLRRRDRVTDSHGKRFGVCTNGTSTASKID